MHHITVSGLTVDIVRKDIKNLHLGVYPPDGRVRVAAPLRLDDEAVRLAVISRLSWIKRQQTKFAAQQRQTPREYLTGESHYYQGRRYLLDVIERPGPPGAAIHSNTRLTLFVRPGSDTARREAVLGAWYRRQLKALIPPLIATWEPLIGVQVAEWGVKHMKTKWGTCSIAARRIWLNLELIKKPPRSLEYILVHEMLHLLERRHNERFTALMTHHLPDWQHLRAELNREPLGHEDWEY